jgi:hypothetical protein
VVPGVSALVWREGDGGGSFVVGLGATINWRVLYAFVHVVILSGKVSWVRNVLLIFHHKVEIS